MITKDKLRIAFLHINNHPDNYETIVAFKSEDSKELDREFFNEFNESLLSDELVEHINNNLTELLAADFDKSVDLGDLSNCLNIVDDEGNEEQVTALTPYLTDEKVCRVGSSGLNRGYCNIYGCVSVEDVTYISESGYMYTVHEWTYNYNNKDIAVVRSLDKNIFPVLNEITEFFPEEYKDIWNV